MPRQAKSKEIVIGHSGVDLKRRRSLVDHYRRDPANPNSWSLLLRKDNSLTIFRMVFRRVDYGVVVG